MSSFTSSLWKKSPASELWAVAMVMVVSEVEEVVVHLLSITASLSAQPGSGSTTLTLLFILVVPWHRLGQISYKHFYCFILESVTFKRVNTCHFIQSENTPLQTNHSRRCSR